jgi:hypothetical protein
MYQVKWSNGCEAPEHLRHDEDDDDFHCWGDFPLLQADMSYLL